MKKYTNIIFDLDGTISNSEEGITKCVQYALAKFGIEENDTDNLLHFIGPPLKEEFIKSYGFNEEDAAKAVAWYRERYEPIGLYEAYAYPGIKELLNALKDNGMTIGIATSKPQEMAEEVLRHFDIYDLFDYIMGADRIGPKQSKTDVLLALFEAMQLSEEDKDNTVLIGDTDYDVIGAKNCHIDCIGVEHGFGDKQSMLDNGAIKVVADAKELQKILIEVM